MNQRKYTAAIVMALVLPSLAESSLGQESPNTWYGPVDLVLNRTGEFQDYGFDHIATETGSWKVYTHLNGWGNFGNPVSISIEELTCTNGK